jgi:D-arabinose 1-dehydrogenase-like Zn-dependent alcohol dehydrogenase
MRALRPVLSLHSVLSSRGGTTVAEGDKVSAEIHVARGKCLQCRTGQAQIRQHVRILGVDANGAFAGGVMSRAKRKDLRGKSPQVL